MSWPEGADGDVFRRLEAGGFDFARPHVIDFVVDFDDWPPSGYALALLRQHYGAVEVIEPGEASDGEDESDGYVEFRIEERLTYELVMRVQARVTQLMEPHGGVCEAWGVLYG